MLIAWIFIGIGIICGLFAIYRAMKARERIK
jgi:hypothetical protein